MRRSALTALPHHANAITFDFALAAIAFTFGEEVSLQLQPLIAPILTLPLSSDLLEALHALTTSVPSVADSLKDRVLDILTNVVAKSSWREATDGGGALDGMLDDLSIKCTNGIIGSHDVVHGCGMVDESAGSSMTQIANLVSCSERIPLPTLGRAPHHSYTCAHRVAL